MFKNNPSSIGKVDGVLASLYRDIVSDLGITAARFNMLVDKYVLANAVNYNQRELISQKGNVKKELTKDVLSWKKFINGLVVLNIKKIKLTVELEHTNTKITRHSKTIILNYIQGEDNA